MAADLARAGFVAAGYTTLASYVVFALSNFYTMRYVSRKHGFTCDYFDLRSLLVISVVFGLLSFVAMSLYENVLIRYGIIISVLLMLGVFYKQVFAFLQKILRR